MCGAIWEEKRKLGEAGKDELGTSKERSLFMLLP